MTGTRKGGLSSAEVNRNVAGSYSSPACFMHEFDAELTAAGTRAVEIKRIYDPAVQSDGFRVLVDRIWPRGIKKQDAALDAWIHELAPSTELRKWFGHDPRRWLEFRARYRAELSVGLPQLDDLRRRAAQQRVTLLYAARDPKFNHAVVLKEFIQQA